MTEQTRNITEAVLAKNREGRLAQLRMDKSMKYISKMDKHLKRLRTLHLYGSTLDEVQAHKEDSYFKTWFQDVDAGDIHAMHSILDHFEPLEIITNMGHNYRSRFSAHSAEIILDFRPGDIIPKNTYLLDGNEIATSPTSAEGKVGVIKSYLYSSILRIAKELILYFPLDEIAFNVNCNDLGMLGAKFKVSSSQIDNFRETKDVNDFISDFESSVLN